MKVINKKYSEMLANFNISSLPSVTSEIREGRTKIFSNHSDGAEDRLLSAANGKQSLGIIGDLIATGN